MRAEPDADDADVLSVRDVEVRVAQCPEFRLLARAPASAEQSPGRCGEQVPE
jgi:hypothetical protein